MCIAVIFALSLRHSFPDSSALNLLDELPRRRLVAVFVDQTDGEYHRLELGAEIGEKEEKNNVYHPSIILVISFKLLAI